MERFSMKDILLVIQTNSRKYEDPNKAIIQRFMEKYGLTQKEYLRVISMVCSGDWVVL